MILASISLISCSSKDDIGKMLGSGASSASGPTPQRVCQAKTSVRSLDTPQLMSYSDRSGKKVHLDENDSLSGVGLLGVNDPTLPQGKDLTIEFDKNCLSQSGSELAEYLDVDLEALSAESVVSVHHS
ncbi:MAG: hypothetical protein KDD25_07430, partial [Bdellovibrionales bacterium]|nr:hypothetical protein [Bdellovibrionales bacterium]